jgi:hypothetical protein
MVTVNVLLVKHGALEKLWALCLEEMARRIARLRKTKQTVAVSNTEARTLLKTSLTVPMEITRICGYLSRRCTQVPA